MRRILIGAVLSQGRVALRVIEVLGEVDPAGVEFRMAIQAHRRVDFHDDLVELVKGHEIAQKALEERDILMPRQVQPNGAERNVGPVLHLHTANPGMSPVLEEELSKRLEAAEGARERKS